MLIKFVSNLGILEGVFYFGKYLLSFEQERKRFELKIVLKSVIIVE